jgi:hypothetical protein
VEKGWSHAFPHSMARDCAYGRARHTTGLGKDFPRQACALAPKAWALSPVANNIGPGLERARLLNAPTKSSSASSIRDLPEAARVAPIADGSRPDHKAVGTSVAGPQPRVERKFTRHSPNRSVQGEVPGIVESDDWDGPRAEFDGSTAGASGQDPDATTVA